MEEILSYANKIGDAFTSTKSYKEYSALHEELKKDREIIAKLNNYRTIKMQNYLTYTVRDVDNKEMDLQTSEMHSELLKNENMKRFLEIEEELMKVLTDVYKIIGDKCILNIELTQ